MKDDVPLRLRFDAFDLDEADATLLRDGRAVPLPPKAFGVLCALARQPGRLVGKDQILDAVWGHRHVTESVLKGTVSEIRAALDDDPKQPRYIETVPRRGYRFIAARTAVAEPPPPMAAPGERRPLIARELPLQRLRAAWRAAQSGRRRIAWIAGEPGVGKTTLLDHFIEENPDALVARGQCVEQFGTSEPYLPVLEALGALCRKDETLAASLRAIAPTWLLQLPWLGKEDERAALRAELAGSTQDRMLREMGELLERYTERQPLILVTEDLHWADDATVRLIDHVARRREKAALLWLATFRPADLVSTDHPMTGVRHELRMHRLCEEIALESFSEVELARYIEARRLGDVPTEVFVKALYRHTDGLPLFVANVLEHMSTHGLESDGAAEDFGVPHDLAGMVERQLMRLDGEEQALLEAASVAGLDFRLAVVADVLDRGADEVASRCDALARRQQWISPATLAPLPDGTLEARYAFRHAIYRHVVYDRIGPVPRAQLHRRVAQAMERLRGRGVDLAPSELALHHERGQDFASALRRYVDAAAQALAHFAPREAVQLTTHALALLRRLPEDGQRMEVELALMASRAVASAQMMGMASPEAQAAFERTYELGSTLPGGPTRAMELSGLGWVFNARGEFAQAKALGEKLHAMSITRGDRLLQSAACGLVGTSCLHRGELIASRRWLEEGLGVFREIGDVSHVPVVIDIGVNLEIRLAHVLSHLGYPDSARACLEGAGGRAERLRAPFSRMVWLVLQGNLEVRLDRPERVAPFPEAIIELAREHAFGPGEAMGRWMRGWCLMKAGQPEDAHTEIRGSFEMLERYGMLWACSGILGHAAEALLLAGKMAEARRTLDEAFEVSRRTGERVFLPDLHLTQARAAPEGSGARRAAMQRALDEARTQSAGWMELASATALCGLPDAASTDFGALRNVVSRLEEGRDTPLMQKARARLREREEAR